MVLKRGMEDRHEEVRVLEREVEGGIKKLS